MPEPEQGLGRVRLSREGQMLRKPKAIAVGSPEHRKMMEIMLSLSLAETFNPTWRRIRQCVELEQLWADSN